MAQATYAPPIRQLNRDLVNDWLDLVDRTVGHGAQALARVIARHLRCGDLVWRARRTLGNELDRNVRTVTRYIAELVDAGLLLSAPRALGRCNAFVARLGESFTARPGESFTARPGESDVDCDGQCPGGVDKNVHQSRALEKEPGVVVPPEAGKKNLAPSGGSDTHEDMIISSCEDPDSRGTMGQAETCAEHTDDPQAPISWPERANVPESARIDPQTAERARTSLGVPGRLLGYLVACYTADELGWLLECAAKARSPLACLHALARRLSTGAAGPGIDRRRTKRRRGTARRPRLDADRARGTHDRPQPVPEPAPYDPPPAPDAWEATWSALDPETRAAIDGRAIPDELRAVLAGMSTTARAATVAVRRQRELTQ